MGGGGGPPTEKHVGGRADFFGIECEMGGAILGETTGEGCGKGEGWKVPGAGEVLAGASRGGWGARRGGPVNRYGSGTPVAGAVPGARLFLGAAGFSVRGPRPPWHSRIRAIRRRRKPRGLPPFQGGLGRGFLSFLGRLAVGPRGRGIREIFSGRRGWGGRSGAGFAAHNWGGAGPGPGLAMHRLFFRGFWLVPARAWAAVEIIKGPSGGRRAGRAFGLFLTRRRGAEGKKKR